LAVFERNITVFIFNNVHFVAALFGLLYEALRGIVGIAIR
jgi:hypothetical protein